MGRQADEDPLSLAIQPPPNETPEQRDSRLQAEALARRISNDIDEELKAEKAALKKKPPVKVLLLGQSESGKFHWHPEPSGRDSTDTFRYQGSRQR